MLFIFVLGTGWGTAIVEAAFLEQVGVEFLPWILIVIAIISIPANAIYTAFADRVTNDKLLIAILGVGIVGIVLGIGLLWANVPLAYPLLYLILYVPLSDILVIHWFTYVNGFYDTRAAKRIVPVIVTSPRVASIIAGLTMPLINRILPPIATILLWATTCGIMAGLVWLMPRLRVVRQRQSETTSTPKPAGRPISYLNNLREGYQYVIQSKFLRWMALSTFLFTILTAFLNVRASQIFYDELRTMEQISNFIGILNGVSNLVMLPLILFGLSRLINTIGLGNANLIYPTGTLIISEALVAWPGLTTAGLAYFARNAFVAGVRNPIDSLLYNAVPLRIKGRARAFMGGLVVPIASLIGNAILLMLTSESVSGFSATNQGLVLLSALGSVSGLGFLISAIFIRKQYAQALVEMLEQEDYSFLLSQRASELTIVDPTALERLHKRLRESIIGNRTSATSASRSHEMTVFLAQLISQIGGREAFPILEEAAKIVLEARTRAAIIDVLALADIRGKAVRYLYLDFLDDPEGSVRQAALIALEKTVETPEEIARLRPQLLKMTQDPDLDVRVQALSVLARTVPDSFSPLDQESLTPSSDTGPAIQALKQLLTAENSHHRARGVQILGQMALGQIPKVYAAQSLLKYLTDPADEVRLQAIIALETITAAYASETASATRHERLPEILRKPLEKEAGQRLQDPVERIRQAAITILGRIGTRTAHTAILDALTDPSPQVRATAVDALVQVGKSIIPLVHPKLETPTLPLMSPTTGGKAVGTAQATTTKAASTTRSVQKMATVILCRISPKEFGGLIQANIMGNLLHIYRNYGYVAALMPYAETSNSLARQRSPARQRPLPSVNILQSALIEQNHQLVDEIFYLLTAVHSPATVKIISESLRSEAPRMRANATEALESLTTPQTAILVAQATQVPKSLDNNGFSKVSLQPLLSLGQDAWDMSPPAIDETLRELTVHADDPWLRALAIFAVGEIGMQMRQGRSRYQAQQPVTTTSTESEKESVDDGKPARRRRSRGRNLLDELTEKLADSSPLPAPSRDTLATEDADAMGAANATEAADAMGAAPFTLSETEKMLKDALNDPAEEVKRAAQAALATRAAGTPSQSVEKEEKVLLSTIEKIIFLKEVPFFQGMTVDQLRVLATVCEEEFFEEDTHIFDEGDPGGVLYVVVQGRVGIEQESRRKGSFARVATIEAHSYFGEMNLFDNSPRTASAIAIQDTLTLRLRREPLIALARQYPNLSLELINVLSARLREAQDAIAERTRTKPRELQKLYDQFR
jgi:CRP-like cAMP-binding protein/HEAT repeat protein